MNAKKLFLQSFQIKNMFVVFNVLIMSKKRRHSTLHLFIKWCHGLVSQQSIKVNASFLIQVFSLYWLARTDTHSRQQETTDLSEETFSMQIFVRGDVICKTVALKITKIVIKIGTK